MKTEALKKTGVIAILVCVAALCLTLTACGGGGGGNEADFVGTWKLTGMEDAEESYGEEDLALMEEMGLTCSLVLTDDKKATLELFGEAMEGSWEAKDGSTLELTFSGETVQGKLADGKISLEEEGMKLVFSKA